MLFSSAFGQDTTCFIKKIDKFTNIATLESKRVQIDPDLTIKIYMPVAKDEGSLHPLNLFFTSKKVTALDEDSRITLIFEDGTKRELGHKGGFELEGLFSVILFNNLRLEYDKGVIENLAKKRITAIRINGLKTLADTDVNDVIGNTIKDTFACMYTSWNK